MFVKDVCVQDIWSSYTTRILTHAAFLTKHPSGLSVEVLMTDSQKLTTGDLKARKQIIERHCLMKKLRTLADKQSDMLDALKPVQETVSKEIAVYDGNESKSIYTLREVQALVHSLQQQIEDNLDMTYLVT